MRAVQGDCAKGCPVSEEIVFLLLLLNMLMLMLISTLISILISTLIPFFVRMSEDYPNAKFCKLDVDEVPEVAQELGVRAMPTFMLFKGGEKVEEVVGANPNAIKTAVEKHYEK